MIRLIRSSFTTALLVCFLTGCDAQGIHSSSDRHLNSENGTNSLTERSASDQSTKVPTDALPPELQKGVPTTFSSIAIGGHKTIEKESTDGSVSPDSQPSTCYTNTLDSSVPQLLDKITSSASTATEKGPPRGVIISRWIIHNGMTTADVVRTIGSTKGIFKKDLPGYPPVSPSLRKVYREQSGKDLNYVPPSAVEQWIYNIDTEGRTILCIWFDTDDRVIMASEYKYPSF